MKLPQPLIGATLVKRYKRFLADARLADGRTVTAHCADPGRLPGLAVEGAPVMLSHSDDPKRKLAYRLEIIEQDGVRVALNTMNANRIVREALENRAIGGFGEYDRVLPEVRIDSSTRLDFALQHEDTVSRYIEVKNVSWNRDGIGAFPDAVTKRGTKHLRTLAGLVQQGHRAVLLFIAQRGDIQRLAIAGDIDPDYLQAFREAIGAGVECVAFNCTVNEIEIRLAARMEVAL
ncbi:MAG: DNA/RNA nuclease SfsA [Geminicoccaceae bacterium]